MTKSNQSAKVVEPEIIIPITVGCIGNTFQMLAIHVYVCSAIPEDLKEEITSIVNKCAITIYGCIQEAYN